MLYTFLFDCFLTLKSDPGQESNLKGLLATANFLSNYTVQLQCLQRAPGRRVTEKSHFSTLNVGLAGTGNRTQATCLASSVSRQSASHRKCRSPPPLVSNQGPLSSDPTKTIYRVLADNQYSAKCYGQIFVRKRIFGNPHKTEDSMLKNRQNRTKTKIFSVHIAVHISSWKTNVKNALEKKYNFPTKSRTKIGFLFFKSY
jgi:hypothetical protein